MRAGIVIFIITALVIANIYTEGKILKKLTSWKKYYQMGGVALAAFVVYWLITKNPTNTRNILTTTNEYIKYLPVDRNTTNMISPILDFTTKRMYSGEQQTSGGYNFPVMSMPTANEQRILSSGKATTKRSVSETKKKFVAARQNWHCENCKKQLPAWFEVDHKIRLDSGGSNHVDNLVALCRDCHGEKTAIENL
jgi:hypothetical protein